MVEDSGVRVIKGDMGYVLIVRRVATWLAIIRVVLSVNQLSAISAGT